uniref:Uncharacterized protein n=1 Tax=Acrobeloides nanus TaxID=290746 RepID=A0A914CYL8_9BILA
MERRNKNELEAKNQPSMLRKTFVLIQYLFTGLALAFMWVLLIAVSLWVLWTALFNNWLIPSHQNFGIEVEIKPDKEVVPFKPTEVMWFSRRFPCKNFTCSENLEQWEYITKMTIKEDWLSLYDILSNEEKSIKKLWLPLKPMDSLNIELEWRKKMNLFCLEEEFGLESFNNSNKDSELVVMNGLYKVVIHADIAYLKPVYWKQEDEVWILARGTWLYEIPKFPPLTYFSELDLIDINQELYFQPIPLINEKILLPKNYQKSSSDLVLKCNPGWINWIRHGFG